MAPNTRRAPRHDVPRIAIPDRPSRRCDVLVVGAGAAGLQAALAARGVLDRDGGDLPLAPTAPDVVLLNNEPRLGLKILVSGGSRCNLTNAHVDERDYETDAPRAVRHLLRGYPSAASRTQFTSRGCPVYEEPLGKVFPRSDDARHVLGVLLHAVARAGIPLVAPAEAVHLTPPDDVHAWQVTLSDGRVWEAPRVILATGGKSLPKTGSRGFGYEALAALGHTVVPPVPALTPLRLADDGPLANLAGLTTGLALTLAPRDAPPDQLAGAKFRPLARAAGSCLVTHHGATGPAPFDVSGACARALLDPTPVTLYADAWSLAQPDSPWAPYRDLPKAPGASLRPQDTPRPPTRDAFDAQLKPRLARRDASLTSALSGLLPKSLLVGLLRAGGVDPSEPVKRLDTRARTRLYRALTQADLRLEGVDGYAKAEVTSGGVPLADLHPKTLESKVAPGLHCCGEVVHVTGRLGGFNFQWSWSSGYAAGLGAAAGVRT